jgi:hypothetical protein
MGWWGFALAAWDIWRRIPKEQRRTIAREVRKHAPIVARAVTREVQRARAAAAARSAGR